MTGTREITTDDIPTIISLIKANTSTDILQRMARTIQPDELRPDATPREIVHRHTALHIVHAGIGAEADPWFALAEDLNDLLDGQTVEGRDAEAFLHIVEDHRRSAAYRVTQTPTVDMDDWVAVQRYAQQYLPHRIADLRFVDALNLAR